MFGITTKRHKTLEIFSNEHPDILTFCQRLRTGFIQSIAPDRIILYANWFYQQNLVLHIKKEEECLFPILGIKNELVKKAASEHRKIRRLFENKTDKLKSISLIEEELEKHVRFEEKILYNEIQKVISEKDFLQLNFFLEKTQTGKEKWNDTFWEQYD